MDLTALTLAIASSSTMTVTISASSTVSGVNAAIVKINLSVENLMALHDAGICQTATSSCFLSITSDLVVDIHGNPVVSIPPESALQVRHYITAQGTKLH